MTRMYKNITVLTVVAALGGCSLAPDFMLPDMGVPAMFKGQSAPTTENVTVEIEGNWKPAAPKETIDRGEWWKVFGDLGLNEYQVQAEQANPSLKAAAARVEQARATVRANISSYLPNIEIGGNAVRAKAASSSIAAFNPGSTAQLPPYTLYGAQGVASYEADLFGRVRDNEKALSLDADAVEATYRGVLLALQADVAQHYFSLRSLDVERRLLRDTIVLRQEAVRIMQRQFDLGEMGETDLARTQSELARVQADLIELDRQRAVLESALAVLLGKIPSEFSFPEAPLYAAPPHIPAGLPSTLLERRPDIVAAQNTMAAANTRIGVAKTAFFPSLILTASGGFESTSLGDLFNWSSRTWALGQLAGSALSMTLFDSGRREGRLDAAAAAYDEAVANYRQQVLVAFKDVEDNLVGQRLLAEQSQKEEVASKAAKRTTALVQKRYDQGDATYAEVVDVQRTSLAAERAAVRIRGERFNTTVALIRALGGGWE